MSGGKQRATAYVILLLYVSSWGVKFIDPSPSELDTRGVAVVDTKKLTASTCQTESECYIATAIEFYENYKFPQAIPILEPIDCSGQKGKEKIECERSNELNAGKPAMYPAVCEPYIWDDKRTGTGK